MYAQRKKSYPIRGVDKDIKALNLNIDLSKDELGPIGTSTTPSKRGGQKIKIKVKGIATERRKHINVKLETQNSGNDIQNSGVLSMEG